MSLLVLLIALVSSPGPVRSQENSSKIVPPVRGEPIIQISKIVATTKELHVRKSPNETTVVVQLCVLGDLPPHATATVEIGSYSSSPPSNDITYVTREETLPLTSRPTTYFFKVRANPKKTVTGSIVIAAVVEFATKGIEVRDPTDISAWRLNLRTVAP